MQSQAPTVLAPKTQQQVVVMVGAAAPALNTPSVALKYRLGGQQVPVVDLFDESLITNRL
eukprot:scaffold22225_cov29-Prasinocladus_malaysianus.AAC.1